MTGVDLVLEMLRGLRDEIGGIRDEMGGLRDEQDRGFSEVKQLQRETNGRVTTLERWRIKCDERKQQAHEERLEARDAATDRRSRRRVWIDRAAGAVIAGALAALGAILNSTLGG